MDVILVSAEFGHREKRDGGVPGSLGIFWAHHGYVRSIADVRDVAHQSPRSHDSEPYRAPRTEGGASAHRPKQGTFFLSPRKREGNEISHIIGAHPQGWPEGAMARGERSHYMTIVEDHGVYASTCGYCKSTKDTFKSHGMSAHACSVEDYQHLIDRGWRRSGNWMYQPVLDDTCCPPYTVRLDVNEFTPTKSQKKVERRFTAYLEGRIDERGAPISREGDAKATHDAGAPTRPGGPTEDDAVAAMIERAVTRAVARCATNGSLSPGVAAVASTSRDSSNLALISSIDARSARSSPANALARARRSPRYAATAEDMTSRDL